MRGSVSSQLTPRGKARRLKSKKDLAHKPSGVGKGRWHSRTSLWKAKRKARRTRLIADASRRRNRTVNQ